MFIRPCVLAAVLLTAVTGGVGFWLLRYRSPPVSALRLSREII